MADILTATPPAEDAAFYQQAFAQCLTEIDQLRAQMAQDQTEIDRARTRAMLADIKATLKRSDRKAARPMWKQLVDLIKRVASQI